MTERYQQGASRVHTNPRKRKFAALPLSEIDDNNEAINYMDRLAMWEAFMYASHQNRDAVCLISPLFLIGF